MLRGSKVYYWLVCCLGWIGSNAYSVVFLDIDPIGVHLNKDGPSSGRSYTGTFDITVGDGSVQVSLGAPYAMSAEALTDIAGYNPTDFTLSSATAYFYLRDDTPDPATEEVRIQFLRNSSYTGSGGDYEFARGQILNQGSSIFDDTVNPTVLASLSNGRIEYTVMADRGNFILDYARLDVVAIAKSGSPAASNQASVPEPASTAGVLTVGLLGWAAARSRKRKISHRD